MTDHQPTPLAPCPDGAEGRPGDNPRPCPRAGSPTSYHPSSPWNERTDGELERLYDLAGDDKLSMTQIASRLQRIDPRITRNGVIGRVHRRGLPPRGAAPNWRPGRYPAERKQRIRVRKPIPPAPPLALAPIVVEPPSPELTGRIGTYTFNELTGRMCHAPARAMLDIRYFGQVLFCGTSCLPIEITGVGPYCNNCEAWIYQVRPAWVGRR